MSAQRIIGILVDDGWVRTHGLGTFSSIIPNGVASMYEKNSRKVCVGLHENGFPPCLIFPRPKSKGVIKNNLYGNEVMIYQVFDSQMLSFIQGLEDDEILRNLNSNEPWKGMTV
jgi:hypothetical protein